MKAKIPKITPAQKVVATAKKHPYIVIGVVAAAGLAIWYVFFRNSGASGPSSTTNPVQAPKTTISPAQTSTTNPSQSTPTSSSNANPFSSSEAPSGNPYTYQAPAIGASGVSSGINTGDITNAPTNNFNYTSNVSNVSKTYTSNNNSVHTQTINHNILHVAVNNNQKTNTHLNFLQHTQTKTYTTSGAFSGLNAGSKVASGLGLGNPFADVSKAASNTSTALSPTSIQNKVINAAIPGPSIFGYKLPLFL